MTMTALPRGLPELRITALVVAVALGLDLSVWVEEVCWDGALVV